MDFWRTISILSKRKWLIALSIVITAMLTLGASKLAGSRWVATVRFASMDNSGLNQLVTGQPATSDHGGRAMESATAQAAVYGSIVASREVVEPAMKSLGVAYDPADLIDTIEFEAKTPRLYELKLTDNDPRRAELIANALSKRFIEQHQELASRQARKVVTLLQTQLRVVNTRLANARKELDRYRSSRQLIGGSVNAADAALNRLQTARQQRDQQMERLAALTAQLNYLQIERAPQQTTQDQPPSIVSQDPPPVESVQPQDELLLQELSAIDAELASINDRYTSQHPRVKDAEARREAVVRRIDAARATAEAANRTRVPYVAAQTPAATAAIPAVDPNVERLRLLRSDVSGANAQLHVLNQSIAKLQGEASRYQNVDGPLAALTAEVNEQSEARSSLVTRLNAAQTAFDVTTRHSPLAITALVNEFNPVANATAGRTKKVLIMAIMCALLGTCGLVVAFDSIDRRLRSVKEAQTALPSRVIAAIPQPMGPVTYSSLARATELEPMSMHAEAYRFLAQHLLSPNGSRARSIMIVSAKSEQGSTTTLSNLGISLAQAGRKVILVDANVRTAELHQVFETPNGYGYVDLLKNPESASLEDALLPTSTPNLEVITVGSIPANPWEIFRSGNIKTISERLLARADYVLYDTPSALLFTDALNVASVVDGAFMCVRALETLTGEEKRLMSLLEQANVEVLGSVLTDVPPSVIEGYASYRHYYAPAIQAAIDTPDKAAEAGPMFVTAAASGDEGKYVG